jgi:hypothetical protein
LTAKKWNENFKKYKELLAVLGRQEIETKIFKKLTKSYWRL